MELKELKTYIIKHNNLFNIFMCCNDYEENFNIEYTYDSTAIEGNKLKKEDIILLIKRKMINKDTNLNSILEIINHYKVFEEVKMFSKHKVPLTEELVKDLHHQLMDNIISGGFYRNHDVRIAGAKHKPPTPNQLYPQIKYFFKTLSAKEKQMDPIELAAYTHAEFVKIHPFEDGNGRTSRLIMNYQLMKNGYLPINIPEKSKYEYFKYLEEYANNNNLKPFTLFIANLELKELKRCQRFQERNKLNIKK